MSKKKPFLEETTAELLAPLPSELPKEKKKQHLISVPADLYEQISRDAREGHRPLSWQIRLYVEAFRQVGN